MAHESRFVWPTMRRLPFRRAASTAALAILASSPILAHDLFFRSSRYHLLPGTDVVIDVLSGTFSKSENAIERDRLADLSVVTPSGRIALDHQTWSEADPKSTLRVSAPASGTYVVGAAVKPRMLSLSGKEFGAYLKEEGLDEILVRRTAQKRLDEPSRERYSKYLKALLQVGDTPSESHGTVLGYAAEIVPEQNPYRLKAGDDLVVRCLVDGKPWAAKPVFAGGRRGSTDQRLPPQRLVTDADGRAKIRLTESGVWYVKFVAMAEVTDAEANYESKWSTLSFAVGSVSTAGTP
jgi:uncharacterized GH25 family protein